MAERKQPRPFTVVEAEGKFRIVFREVDNCGTHSDHIIAAQLADLMNQAFVLGFQEGELSSLSMALDVVGARVPRAFT